MTAIITLVIGFVLGMIFTIICFFLAASIGAGIAEEKMNHHEHR